MVQARSTGAVSSYAATSCSRDVVDSMDSMACCSPSAGQTSSAAVTAATPCTVRTPATAIVSAHRSALPCCALEPRLAARTARNLACGDLPRRHGHCSWLLPCGTYDILLV